MKILMSTQPCPKVFNAIGGLTVRCGGRLQYLDGRLTESGVAWRTWESEVQVALSVRGTADRSGTATRLLRARLRRVDKFCFEVQVRTRLHRLVGPGFRGGDGAEIASFLQSGIRYSGL
jgi:hypothetical protein